MTAALTGEGGLALRDLRVAAPNGAALLRGVSLSARPGEPLAILGETGSGKSLVLEALAGTLAPELAVSGAVAVNGVETAAADGASRHALWGGTLSTLPQEPWTALDPTMRALFQVAETHRFVAGRSRDEARRRANADLAALGLSPEAARRFPHQLSGGMSQRVAIAAVRATGAPLMLADEPTKGLDAARRDDVAALLRGAVGEGGTLLAVTHDPHFARSLGGRVAVMLDGAVVEQGPAQALLDRPGHAYTRRLLAAEPDTWERAAAGTHVGAPVVEARGLAVEAGGKVLLSGLDLAVAPGEWVAVTGPSGCGKTTLGDVLLGLRRPAAGTVRRAPGLPRTAFGKLYQDPVATFAPGLPLRLALAEAARLHGTPWDGVLAGLGRLGIGSSLLDRLPGQVSGGELQRVAIVRALLPRPVLLFADEPTSRLDLLTQQETLLALRQAAADCAVLLVTHDAGVARALAGRVLHL